VVNNNAAALLLCGLALAHDREIIVSRGELVEIGDGFRIPDLLTSSGARLREVGTTNRCSLRDYRDAIGPQTAVILKVHPSNFVISGFTSSVGVADLATLGPPVVVDIGSGLLAPHPLLPEEPDAATALAQGACLVTASGDKLLGGPQAGVVVGRRQMVDLVRRHPLMRAVRAGKQTYAALEATLALWQREPARTEIPVVRMLLESVDAINQRAEALIKTTSEVVLSGDRTKTTSEVVLDVINGHSTIGGGSVPDSSLPTRLVSIRSRSRTAAHLEAALRAGSPPIIARVQHDTVLLDLRTVDPADDDVLFEVLNAVLCST
jgi:L-seryl-tRNA(Ser) seleniumtransferase